MTFTEINKKFLEKLRGFSDTKKKIILWTVVIILGLVMGFFWVKKASEGISKIGESAKSIKFPEVELPNMPDIGTLIDPTVDWKTYTDKQYGFEIKYPSDLVEQKIEAGTTLLATTKIEPDISYYFTISIIKNYKVNQIVSNIKDAEEINIGGHSGYKYFYIEGVGTSGVAIFQVGNNALNISFDYIDKINNSVNNEDREMYVQIFLDDILSTLKFE